MIPTEICLLLIVGMPVISIIGAAVCSNRCKHDYKKIIKYMGRGGTTKYMLVCSKCGKTKYLRG